VSLASPIPAEPFRPATDCGVPLKKNRAGP
jgi:hypothetical protein